MCSRPASWTLTRRDVAPLLADLVQAWDLTSPALVGRDIGGGAALRAHLIEAVAPAMCPRRRGR